MAFTSMYELFRQEVEAQSALITEGLLAIEQHRNQAEHSESLMRAAHSIKGAARIVRLEPIVALSHAMEDCFEAFRKRTISLTEVQIDLLFKGVDVFTELIQVVEEDVSSWVKQHEPKILEITKALTQCSSLKTIAATPYTTGKVEKGETGLHRKKLQDRTLRVSSYRLNRLMGLAGESAVESLWLQPFENALFKLKENHEKLMNKMDRFSESIKALPLSEQASELMAEIQQQMTEDRSRIESRIADLQMFIRRHTSLSERLYGDVIDMRMRPLADGLKGLARFVRDLARELGKKARLEIIGQNTAVDRDILDKLEAPLTHLLRNAIDHGIESTQERIRLGKPAEGLIRIEACHQAGMLLIKVSDDGHGIDEEKIRVKVVADRLVTNEVATHLTEIELLDFLFLPGFSTAPELTEISGRGVGLNVVQTMIQEVGGSIRTETMRGKGSIFTLQLPLTLSVIRSLVVEIGKEPYAFPLARIDRSLQIDMGSVKTIENRQYIEDNGKKIELISAGKILADPEFSDPFFVVVVSNRTDSYGIIVDRFIGEKDLVVQEIDPLLGKVAGISAGAFMEDGSVILIVDVEDLISSIEKIMRHGDSLLFIVDRGQSRNEKIKKILVVEDSMTVREVECRLLQNHGYHVQGAVNGIDGWNALKAGSFDLVITDIDMPRMNGIELVKAMKADPKIKDIPVLIVSYKDRAEDEREALDAGADRYLTKSRFHDETLINTVEELLRRVSR